MDWKNAVNRGLERTLGLTLVRAGHRPEPRPVAPARPPADKKPQAVKRPAAAKRPKKPVRTPVDHVSKELVRPAARPEIDRLLKQPVFVMSTVRSGSTLLRVLLDAHSQILAPHELHIRRLRVHLTTGMAQQAMNLLGLNEADLEHLLWDRVLHRELVLSGKSILVDKTPSNTFAFDRLRTVWPDARFIFLLRHPASIAQSWVEVTRHKQSCSDAITDAMRYMRALNRARDALDGLTVRYEDLTADPATVTRQICEFLGVPWEAGMLDYGGTQEFVKGVGDWSERIRTGTVQAGRRLPSDDQIPDRLLPMCRRWGYLDAAAEQEPGADPDASTTEGDVPVDDSTTDEAMQSATNQS